MPPGLQSVRLGWIRAYSALNQQRTPYPSSPFATRPNGRGWQRTDSPHLGLEPIVPRLAETKSLHWTYCPMRVQQPTVKASARLLSQVYQILGATPFPYHAANRRGLSSGLLLQHPRLHLTLWQNHLHTQHPQYVGEPDCVRGRRLHGRRAHLGIGSSPPLRSPRCCRRSARRSARRAPYFRRPPSRSLPSFGESPRRAVASFSRGPRRLVRSSHLLSTGRFQSRRPCCTSCPRAASKPPDHPWLCRTRSRHLAPRLPRSLCSCPEPLRSCCPPPTLQYY